MLESCTMKSTWYFAKIAQVEELLETSRHPGVFRLNRFAINRQVPGSSPS
jgi:hypothetical protein